MTLTTQSALRKDQTNAGGKLEHRHFAVIAGIIAALEFHNECTKAETSDRNNVAHQFADALAHTNPRFDRARFLRACGVAS